MRRNHSPLLLVALTLGAVLLASAPEPAKPGPDAEPLEPTGPLQPVSFGMGVWYLDELREAGVPADYGVFWVGSWSLDAGWNDERGHLRTLRAANVTPAIHLYYWGDDMSPSCLAQGCRSGLHGAWKDADGWERLTEQFVAVLREEMDGGPVVVILESEFNKASVATHEPLDEALAARAGQVHAGYPAARVVLGFGGWGLSAWGTWDRAAAASDAVGFQLIRASTRHSADAYAGAAGFALEAAQALQERFGQPVFLHDLALSSYPEPAYLDRQADALEAVFGLLPEMKGAGVEAILYRSWCDTQCMDPQNYFGEAERHWGLHSKDGFKPAGHIWVDGVQAERADPAVPAVPAVPTGAVTRPRPGPAPAPPRCRDRAVRPPRGAGRRPRTPP